MAIQTKITVQQMMMKESGGYRVGKYPRYIITLGNSLSSVTVEELATAVGNANAAANAAAASQIAAKTSETNAKTSETNANSSKNAAASSATAAKTSETNAKTSETNAKTSETNANSSKNAAKTSETNAKTSETNAATSAQTALDALQGIKDAQDQSPFPDVWIPMNDSLQMWAGSSPYDRVYLGNQYVELTSKSVPLSRSSTATYIDKSGVVQTADINEPRFEREGLLMEGTSTNRALYSGNMDNPWWPTARVSKVPGFPAPDGSMNAIKMVSTIETGSKYISKPLVVSAEETYTLSFFVKAAEVTQCRVNFSGNASTNNMSCDFDLLTGEVKTATSSGIPSITKLSDGWWRVSASSETFATGGSANFNIWMINGLGPNATIPPNDGVSGMYIWGAQIEANPVMTSYIPTTTAAVTRASETLRLQPSGNIGYNVVGDLINRTIAFEISVNSFVPTSAGYFNLLATVGVANDIILRIATTQINSLRSSGSLSPTIAVTHPIPRQIFAQTLDSNDLLTVYFNNQVASRLGAPANPAGKPTSVNFSSQSQLVYHMRNFRIWHQVLTSNQIKGLK